MTPRATDTFWPGNGCIRALCRGRSLPSAPDRRLGLVLIAALTLLSGCGREEAPPLPRGVEYIEQDLPRGAFARYDLELSGERAGPEAVKEFRIPAGSTRIYGIDVSHYQERVDWRTVPTDGVVFAFAKASQGASAVDRAFARHWEEMRALRDAAAAHGRPSFFRGAYHFYRADHDPRAQAERFIQTVGALGPGDTVSLDLEWDWTDLKARTGDRWDTLSPPERVRRVKLWLDAVERTLGRAPIIYTNYHFWNEKLGRSPDLARYPLWIADYSSRSAKARKPLYLPPGFLRWTLWQFTDTGRVNGIRSRVDVNQFSGSLADLKALTGLAPPPPSSGTGTEPLARGAQGSEVQTMQEYLVALGYLPRSIVRRSPGVFGARTEAALKAFQEQNYLVVHGAYDADTRAALESVAGGIRLGSSGEVVRRMRDRLAELQLLAQEDAGGAPAAFDAKDEAALKRLQQRQGLPVSGVLDPATYRALYPTARMIAPEGDATASMPEEDVRETP